MLQHDHFLLILSSAAAVMEYPFGAYFISQIFMTLSERSMSKSI